MKKRGKGSNYRKTGVRQNHRREQHDIILLEKIFYIKNSILDDEP